MTNEVNTNSNSDSQFDNYKLLERLEQGPMGDIFKAIDTSSGRTVLLKIASSSASQNPQFLKLFEEQQALLTRQPDHPNIITLLDVRAQESKCYLAIEYVEGKTLADKLAEGQIPLEESIEILKQICEGLRAAHQKRVFHGDVKPANIILSNDSKNRLIVKVSFQDLAVATSQSMVSVFGEIVGTPKYMSPEQIHGLAIDARSDIFSLGVIAYEMIAGKAPFESQNVVGYLHRNAEEDAPPVTSIVPSIPNEVSLIIQKMMARDHSERYRGCQSILDDLERVENRVFAGHTEIVAAGVDSAFAMQMPMQEQRRTPQRTAVFTKIFAVAAVLCLVIIVVLTYSVYSLWKQSQAREVVQVDGTPPDNGSQKRQGSRATTGGATARTRSGQTTIGKNEAEGAYRAAEELYESGKYSEAMEKFSEISQKYGATHWAREAKQKAPQILSDWADSLRESGDYEEALAKLSELAEKHSDAKQAQRVGEKKGEILCDWGESLSEQKDHEGALKKFQQVIQAFRGSEAAQRAQEQIPKVMFGAVDDCLEKGDYDGAIKSLRELQAKRQGESWAEEVTKKTAQVYYQMAKTFGEKGEYAKATDALAELFDKYDVPEWTEKAKQDAPKILVKWIQSLMEAGKIGDAVNVYEKKLLAKYPKDPWVAGHGEEMARYKNDLSAYKAGKPGTTDVELDELMYYKGKSFIDSEQFDQGIAKLEELRSRFPKSSWDKGAKALVSQSLYEYGLRLMGQGKLQEGNDKHEKILKEYPDTLWAEKVSVIKAQRDAAPPGMVYVPPGSVFIGIDEEELKDLINKRYKRDVYEEAKRWYLDETPKHKVKLASFYIDEHEVTNEQYKKFVDETGHAAPSVSAAWAEPYNWKNGTYPHNTGNYPVVLVSYEDAAAYAKWAGKRLPTEEEWEKAARGTDGRFYPWGDEFDSGKCHVKAPGSNREGTAAVRSYPEDRSPYGCYDMAGNVYEWTASLYKPYKGFNAGLEFDQTKRVLRGGSWRTDDMLDIRCTNRFAKLPFEPAENYGFRCVKDVD